MTFLLFLFVLQLGAATPAYDQAPRELSDRSRLVASWYRDRAELMFEEYGKAPDDMTVGEWFIFYQDHPERDPSLLRQTTKEEVESHRHLKEVLLREHGKEVFDMTTQDWREFSKNHPKTDHSTQREFSKNHPKTDHSTQRELSLGTPVFFVFSGTDHDIWSTDQS